MDYAGFWIRVVAYLIDAVILGLVGALLGLLSGGAVIDLEAQDTLGITDFLGLIVGIAYFIGFEGSEMQATPGKKVLGLIVTDMRGQRISYPRAAGRYFGKLLSAAILLIGYIMVAFTEKKQGLHDLLASTLVVKGRPGMVGYDPSVFD
ncbi:MAG: RDD family protein [Alphaproteobacteria bacterium]|jgi:uncharacterized RDD family membrane protein YckC|nr:RDD family protein [Alphaproteobacteria bacterium]